MLSELRACSISHISLALKKIGFRGAADHARLGRERSRIDERVVPAKHAGSSIVVSRGLNSCRFFTHDGLRFHYRDEGQGLPFVFQHGLGGDLNQPFGLYRPAAGVRLIAFDMRGHGETVRSAISTS